MLTVIIPTRNRVDLLKRALISLDRQSLPKSKFEVVVIDNGSTDQTADLVSEMAKSRGFMRYCYEPNPGLHVGRHRGLVEAKGDVLVYADDDIQATPTWLEAVAYNFEKPAVSMLGGNNYPDFQGHVPAWLNKLWARPALGGQAIIQLSVISLPEGQRRISPYYVWGCNFSIRKQIVLDAGGFHPDGMPKELIRFRGDGETHISKYVLDNRLECRFDSRASVYHAVTAERMTHDYFRKHAFNHGISDSFTQIRNSMNQKSWSDFPRKFTRRLVGGMRNLLKPGVENDPEIMAVTTLMAAGYKEGYEYHQRAYREDPEVRAWLHKADYF